jgi:acyl carrier protein
MDRVRPQDNFFRVGGNSLLGLQVTSELRRRFDVDLSPHSLFESPTVAELARSIEELILADIEAARADSLA